MSLETVDIIEESNRRPKSAPRPSRPRAIRNARLSRAIWRWHFYAGVLTSPILIIVTLTGLLYIFSPEIERVLHQDRLFVQPTSNRIPPSALIETAAASRPGWEVSRLAIEPADNRSVVVSLTGGDGQRSRDLYIDPYRGNILADVDPAQNRVHNFFHLVLDIHRSLFIGTTGRVLVELATCWGILLMLTGVYLWWPRRWNMSYGVWLPRLRAKPYTVQRDLHTVVGIYALPLLMIISLTGMFYTVVWGKGVVAASIVASEGLAGLSEGIPGRGGPRAEKPDSPIDLPLVDKAVRLAGSKYPDRALGLDLAAASNTSLTVHALGDYAVNSRGAYEYTKLSLNPREGTIVKQEPLAEDSQFWWHRWTYPLHVGSVWGLPTKILWAIACLVLIGLPVTGLWMWWIRRPQGRSGIPRRPPVRLPLWLVGLVALACLVFPVAGASVLVFVGVEWAWGCCRRKEPIPARPR